MNVVIIGGGIVGMLSAKMLLERGASVTIIDKSELGTEASWAGGGIVSPLYPWTYTHAITALSNWAQQYYPELVAQLKQTTEIDPEFNPCGLLMLDPPDLEQAERWAADNEKVVHRLTADQVHMQEPAAQVTSNQNLWLPYVGNVRNPRLLKSLQQYLLQQENYKFVTNAEVKTIKQTPQGIEIRSNEKILTADKVIMCTGAWTQALLQNNQFDTRIEIAPVKGQMVLFEPKPGLIKSIILHKGKYLIPRLDGRIIVGSTLEHQEFDKTPTEEAKSLLLQKAYEIVPELKNLKVEAHWAGLRPGSSGGLPYIGKVPGWDNLYVNAGHFRNGLVLAPASARLISDILLEHTPIVDPAPYDPARPKSNEPMH